MDCVCHCLTNQKEKKREERTQIKTQNVVNLTHAHEEKKLFYFEYIKKGHESKQLKRTVRSSNYYYRLKLRLKEEKKFVDYILK